MIGRKGLFGKVAKEGAMMPSYSQQPMQVDAPMPARQGGGIKDILLAALGGAADSAATFFGGQPLIAQNQQMQQMMAMRQAEDQRRRAAELADYRTKLGIQQEFEQPEAPKPGSFEWYNSPTTTDAERAAYDRYNPVIAATGMGPVIVPRAGLGQQSGPQVGAVEDGYRFKGGNPSDPASWEPVESARPTAQQQPLAPFTRDQYEGLVQARGDRAWVDNWMRQNGIRVVN